MPLAQTTSARVEAVEAVRGMLDELG
jgi:hypothetical protein